MEGYIQHLKEKFESISNENYWGYLRNNFISRTGFDVKLMIENFSNKREKMEELNQGFYIKKLGNDEIEKTIPDRWNNHLIIDRYILDKFYFKSIPRPLGIVYTGEPIDLLSKNSEVYLISEYIKGKILLNPAQLNGEIVNSYFRTFGESLKDMRKEGIYLMDFAPRDIIPLGPNNDLSPIFLDLEHMIFGDKIDFELFDSQKAQFMEDYGHLLRKDYDSIEEIVFGSIE